MGQIKRFLGLICHVCCTARDLQGYINIFIDEGKYIRTAQRNGVSHEKILLSGSNGFSTVFDGVFVCFTLESRFSN